MPQLHPEALDVFPALETDRLLLRAPASADAPALFRLYSDARIMRYRGEPLFSGVQEAEALIEKWTALFAEKKGLRWAITLKGDNALIGTAGYKRLVEMQFRGEIGYELDPVRWNRGLMTEALRAVTAWGFRAYGLHSIEANIAPGNAASRRVLEKLGFVQEAHFRQNYYFEGWWDSVIYSLHEKALSA